MLKIYLAGPFFNDKQIATIEAIENEFDKYGFDYFSPRTDSGVISHLSLEGRTKKSKNFYDRNVDEMIKANVIFAIVDGQDASPVYEMGYFRALTDHFVYKTEKGSKDLKRYSVAYTNENFGLDIMLKESVDAHVVCEPDLRSFCGIMAGNWDAPVGKEGLPEWQDNQARREKIFSQFQNFNSDK